MEITNAHTETELEQLSRRNKERAEAMKQALGRKYLCHPDNHVRRLDGRPRIAVVEGGTPLSHPRLTGGAR